MKSDAIIGALEGVTKKWAKQRKREERNLSTTLRHSSLRFTEHFLLLMTGRVG